MKSTEGVIIGDVHQFIRHCLIPLDPCTGDLSNFRIKFKNITLKVEKRLNK